MVDVLRHAHITTVVKLMFLYGDKDAVRMTFGQVQSIKTGHISFIIIITMTDICLSFIPTFMLKVAPEHKFHVLCLPLLGIMASIYVCSFLKTVLLVPIVFLVNVPITYYC
jgi:hypothetical protein